MDKVVILIIDGASGEDLSCLNSLTDAHITYSGTHTPKGFDADSLCCIMSMLGCDVEDIPRGRAYLEALAEGIDVNEDDLIFRCNGVKIIDDMLISSSLEMPAPDIPEGYFFHPMGAHKNLLILNGRADAVNEIRTFPPHENLGRNINDILPSFPDKKTEDFLVRLAVNGYWVWGESVLTEIPVFENIHGSKAAMVCRTEIVKGIAEAMDIYSPYIPGTTAETDTDLHAKTTAAVKLTEEYDTVFIHINGADEAAHRKDHKEKADFLRRVEDEVIVPLKKRLAGYASFIVTSDHVTDQASGSHKKDAVNTYIFFPNKESEKWQRYL